MLNILAAVFNIIVGLGLPLGALVWLIIRRRGLVWPYIAGALTFFITQMLLRVPLLQLLAGQAWYVAFARAQPIIYSLLLGLSAGIFEELGRYGTMRLTMKKKRTWQAAIAFGIGHGGIEGILLVGVNYSYQLMMNLMHPALFPLPTASLAVLAGAERLFTYIVHIGLSVMVMRAIQRKKPLWLLLAILIHGIIDGMLGIWQQFGWGYYAIEGYIALCAAALSAYTIVTIRKELQQHEKEPGTL